MGGKLTTKELRQKLLDSVPPTSHFRREKTGLFEEWLNPYFPTAEAVMEQLCNAKKDGTILHYNGVPVEKP